MANEGLYRHARLGIVKKFDSVSRISIGISGCAVAVAMFFAAKVVAPSIRPDEWGYLLNGQVLLGRDEARLPFASLFPAGFGLVTGSWAWVTGSIQGSYRMSLFTNVLLVALLGYLVFVYSRRNLHSTQITALLASAIVIASPGTLVGSLFSTPETLCKVLFMVLLIVIAEISTRATYSKIFVFAFVAGFIPVFSSRLIAVTLSASVVLLMMTRERIITKKVLSVSVTILVLGYYLARVLNSIVRNELYFGREAGESRIIQRIFRIDLWPEIIREVFGQIWYLQAASGCLALVAVAIFCQGARSKRNSFSVFTKTESAGLVFILLTLVTLLVLGATQLAIGMRADHFIYGRYIETCIPPLVVLALVALERDALQTLRIWRHSILFFFILAASHVLILRTDVVRRAISVDGAMRTANILAVDAVAQLVQRPGLVTMTSVFLVVSIALYLLYKRYRQLALVVFASLFLLSSVWTSATTLTNRSKADKGVGQSIDASALSTKSRIAFDGTKPQDRRYFTLRYAIHPIILEWVGASDDRTFPQQFACVYGAPDRFTSNDQWVPIGAENSIDLVLWRRSGATSC